MNPATQINPTYTEFDRTMASGDETSLEITGDFVVCIEATNAFKIGFNNGPKTNFRKGFRFRMTTPITSVQLLNNSGLSNTITLGVGRGDIRDARLVLPSTGIATKPPSRQMANAGRFTVPANSNVVVVAANSSRISAYIGNSGSSIVWVSSENYLYPRGLPCLPNGFVEVPFTEAIRVYNPSGAALAVTHGEMELV